MDTSLQYAKNLLELNAVPENLLIAIIPVYNIDGMLNRGSFSRTNQLGAMLTLRLSIQWRSINSAKGYTIFDVNSTIHHQGKFPKNALRRTFCNSGLGN